MVVWVCVICACVFWIGLCDLCDMVVWLVFVMSVSLRFDCLLLGSVWV